MALNEIRRRIIADYNEEHLLDSIPSHESMEWVPVPAASPPTALVLGTVDGRDILAFQLKLGDKPRQVQYCSVPAHRAVYTFSVHPLSQDEVVQLPLNAPFKYNANVSKAAKRKFSIVIKWYFIVAGLVVGDLGSDYTDYCKRFHGALRAIDEGQRAEIGRHEESPEPDEQQSAYGLRSVNHDNEGQQPEVEQLSAPLEKIASARANEDENVDLIKLREYLDSHEALYLLRNIPEADEVHFEIQYDIPYGLPEKLFVGHSNDGEDIYAYMLPSRNYHEINFYVEDIYGTRRATSAEHVAKQKLLHPFNKTYAKNSPTIQQSDRTRLAYMVKWYFIAAGVARNIVLRETKAYPKRLRSALEYIATRMGPAAFVPTKDQIVSPILDEDHTQSTSATTTPLPTSSPVVQRTPSQLETAHTLRGTKRSAEDVGFEDLARTLAQDQELTKQINDVDQELDILELQRQDFMEKLEKDHHDMMEKRRKLDGRRGDVRKKFKRQSLAVADKEDS